MFNKKRNLLRPIIMVLTGLFLFSVVGLLFVHVYMEVPLGPELMKAFLQMGVVAGAGTIVSLVVFEYQRERQNQDKQKELDRKSLEYREELLKTVLGRAMKCYSQCKKARRLLRARALSLTNDEVVVDVARYDELLEVVNDLQLELENLVRDVRNSAKAFSSPEEIAKNLRIMEEYLKTLVSEYEQARRRAPRQVNELPLKLLPKLDEFLQRRAEGPFHVSIVIPYQEVQLLIRDDLLHPHLPVAK